MVSSAYGPDWGDDTYVVGFEKPSSDSSIRLEAPEYSASWTFTEPEVVIGRRSVSQIVLSGDGISRAHFRLVRQNGSWSIIDGSKNGTYVNGIKIQPGIPRPLRDRDIILVKNGRLATGLPGSGPINQIRWIVHLSQSGSARPSLPDPGSLYLGTSWLQINMNSDVQYPAGGYPVISLSTLLARQSIYMEDSSVLLNWTDGAWKLSEFSPETGSKINYPEPIENGRFCTLSDGIHFYFGKASESSIISDLQRIYQAVWVCRQNPSPSTRKDLFEVLFDSNLYIPVLPYGSGPVRTGYGILSPKNVLGSNSQFCQTRWTSPNEEGVPVFYDPSELKKRFPNAGILVRSGKALRDTEWVLNPGSPDSILLDESFYDFLRKPAPPEPDITWIKPPGRGDDDISGDIPTGVSGKLPKLPPDDRIGPIDDVSDLPTDVISDVEDERLYVDPGFEKQSSGPDHPVITKELIDQKARSMSQGALQYQSYYNCTLREHDADFVGSFGKGFELFSFHLEYYLDRFDEGEMPGKDVLRSLLVSLKHDNLIPIAYTYSDGESLLFGQKQLKLPSLQGYIDANGSLEEIEAFLLLEQIVDLMVFLQQQNPPILLSRLDPSSFQINLESRLFYRRFNSLESLAETWKPSQEMNSYIPAERYSGKNSLPGTFYSFGMLALYLLFATDPAEITAAYGHNVNFEKAGISLSGEFSHLIRRCIRVAPDARYQTLEEFLEDFRLCRSEICPGR